MRQFMLLLLVVVGLTHAATKSYDVVPFKNYIGVQPLGRDGVTQYYRNTLDSLTAIWLWVGDTIDTSSFKIEVRDSVVGTHRVAWNPGQKATQCWAWLKLDLLPDPVYKPVRGRTYKITVTRPTTGTAISFAYDPTNPYKYGHAVANNSSPSLDSLADLALRVIGVHDTISRTWWGYQTWAEDSAQCDSHNVHVLAESAGAGLARVQFAWTQLWPDSNAFTFAWKDKEVRYVMNKMGCEVIGLLDYTAAWASSRIDSIRARGDTIDTFWCEACPPLNLYNPAQTNSGNYWYDYVREVIKHYNDTTAPGIHTWEIWNEPNDTNRFWRPPDTGYTLGEDRGRDMSVLYARLCVVAESAISSVRPDDTVLIGSLVCLQPSVTCRIDPFEMLSYCYQYGQGASWDGVSAHYYADPDVGFAPTAFDAYAETLRTVMKDNGDYGELWLTETGWEVYPDTSAPARWLCKAFSSAAATGALPQGCYDRICYYSFRVDTLCGVLDTGDMPRPAFYAACLTARALTGKRLNGRVMAGDSTVRVYEFENPADSLKTWVCWQDHGGTQLMTAQLPARTDSASLEALDYGEHAPPTMRQVNSGTGWLTVGGLGERPQFVTEPASVPISRPDVVVDSFRVMPERPQVGKEMGFTAYVRNTDSVRATPDPVWYKFLCDTTTVCSVPGPSIGPGESDTVTVIGCVVQNWMRGEHLFRIEANPGQKFVEKNGLDDNDGYSRHRVTYFPGGDIRGDVCGGHSNSPLPLFGLETHSYEVDTLGSVPAESARMVQWAYHVGDTVPYGGDTTAWFDASAAVALDTSWLYLSGQGKYKLFLQVKDSWSMSDLIPDTTHPYVIFDTTGPSGSVVINSGDRFTTSSTVTLSLAASDSASGVCKMRFMNVPKVDLVVGGSFTATAGSWEYENAEVDTLLRMARLTAAPVEATVRQFIPAESISAHAGDSCVLEASILAHVHEDSASGCASFWYYSTRVDSENLHDTLFTLVDSAHFSGNLLSLTGRYNLSKRFLLSPPSSDSEWVWKGGMVRVEAVAEDGNGFVWTDNVALNTFAPESGYGWWGQYDTLAERDMGAEAGVHIIRALFLDSAGNENATPCADTVIVDPTAPVVDISVPDPGTIVNGTLEVTGWAYDPVEVAGDTWFESRHLSYRHTDSTNWLPVDPDSASCSPAYPDSQQILGPAVHLGYWNTLSLEDGTYYLMLTAADSAGHVSSCTTWVIVSNQGDGGGEAGGPEGGGEGMGEGSVYVGSATGCVLHLSDDLDSLDCFQVSDSGSQAKVTAILEVADDSLLVLDAANKRIHKLHKNGQNRRRLVSNLSIPAGITRDDNGNFWLVDKGLHKIGKFRSNGTPVFTRGGFGTDSLHFDSPEAIAVKGGLVYVADTKNDRIAVWDTSGNYKTVITGDFEKPTAVWVQPLFSSAESSGSPIYLTDGSDGKLKGITPLGGNIVAIGTDDSAKLRGLVPSENRHSLFSLAPVPNKVYKLRIMSDDSAPGGQQSAGAINLPKTLSLAQPFPNPARTRLNIAYALPRQTRVVLKLYDVAGKLVKTLANSEHKPGYYNLTWSRQDAKGRSCACGVYFCALTAENQRFCRKVILTE